MRKLVLVLLIGVVFFNSSFAPDYVPTPAEVDHFYQTKTLVVLEDNPLCEYNFVIKEFMQKEWKLTQFDFISPKEFEEKRKDKQYSFILINQVRFENDKSLARYNFLSLVLGSDDQRAADMPDLCPVPLSYVGVEEDSYNYKLQNILRFMQNHVELIHSNPKLIKTNMLKFYNDNAKSIKGKTLYLLKDEMTKECNTEDKIKKVYPHDFKFVTKEEITKAIAEKDTNVVFLHKVGPQGTRLVARCYKILIGAADSKFYYFNYHKITHDEPDGMLLSDFKKLGKK